MLWGSIKAAGFVGLAVATGVVCTTVPIGGKTLAARMAEFNPPPAARHATSEMTARVKREVEEAPPPTPTPAAKPGKIDPDAPTGDSLRASEREAISHLIQQKARPGKAPKRP
jgi:hypothetical protein